VISRTFGVVSPHSTIKLTSLQLVYPPISNQEAVWIERERDPDVRDALRTSDFYMIVGRPDCGFSDVEVDPPEVRFSIRVGEAVGARSAIDMADAVDPDHLGEVETFILDLGDKLIRARLDGPTEDSEVLAWFTPDKLAWDHANGHPGLDRVEIPAGLITYDLLYIGIASEGDSYRRLIESGHQRRTEILANEPQRFPGARVTDEILLLFFRLESLYMRTLDVEALTPEYFLNPREPDRKRVVKDLEKALVSQLRPSYNRTTYDSYPRSADGLEGSGLDRYGYVIAENMVLRTAVGEFHGSRGLVPGLAGDAADFVVVADSDVAVIHHQPGAEQ